MGTYINPPADKFGPMAKEAWMIRNINDGKLSQISKDRFYEMVYETVPDDKLILVLMDNGAFTALAVCDSESEFEYFQLMLPTDERKTFVLICDKETALEYAR